MKYIKTYKIFENSNSDLISKLKRYGIENYTINNDGSIDVNGNANLSDNKLKKIPFNFREVNGYFNCGDNQLTSLTGCPIEISNDFSCSDNKLESLEFCSSEITVKEKFIGNINEIY